MILATEERMRESLNHKNIQILAFCLYEAFGQPEEKDLDLWLEAERQLKENIFERASNVGS